MLTVLALQMRTGSKLYRLWWAYMILSLLRLPPDTYSASHI